MFIFVVLGLFLCLSIIVIIETSFPNLTVGNLYASYSKHKNLQLTLKLKKNLGSNLGSLLLYDNIFSSLLINSLVHLCQTSTSQHTLPYFIISIPLFVTLWEAVIKAYIIQDSARFAIIFSPLANLLFKIARPLSFLIDKIADLMVGFFKKPIVTEEAHASFLEVKSAFDFHHSIFPSEETAMVKNLMSLKQQKVEQIMVHRKDFEQIEFRNIEFLINSAIKCKHNEIVLWEIYQDNVIGTLDKFHIFEVCYNNPKLSNKELLELLRKKINSPKIIPASSNLSILLRRFKETGGGIYIVVNEYGAVMGLVTPQDMFTNIVGELEVSEQMLMKKLGKGVLVHGEVSIREINRFMFWDLDDKYNNIADLVLSTTKNFPEVNTEGFIGQFFFRILQCNKQMIEIVYLMPIDPKTFSVQ